MRPYVLLLATTFSALTAACGALAAEQSFPVGTFNRVALTGPFDVQVTTGRQPSVRASGDRAAIDRLEISVVNGELRVDAKPGTGWNWRSGNVTVLVTAPGIVAARLAGSGNLAVDHVSGSSFSGAVAGSGDLGIARSEAEKLDLVVNGSGDLTIAGQCGTATLGLRGSGDIHASQLMCRDISVALAGSGDVVVGASGSANLSLAGSGDITVSGGAHCTTSKRGSGDIRCR